MKVYIWDLRMLNHYQPLQKLKRKINNYYNGLYDNIRKTKKNNGGKWDNLGTGIKINEDISEAESKKEVYEVFERNNIHNSNNNEGDKIDKSGYNNLFCKETNEDEEINTFLGLNKDANFEEDNEDDDEIYSRLFNNSGNNATNDITDSLESGSVTQEKITKKILMNYLNNKDNYSTVISHHNSAVRGFNLFFKINQRSYLGVSFSPTIPHLICTCGGTTDRRIALWSLIKEEKEENQNGLDEKSKEKKHSVFNLKFPYLENKKFNHCYLPFLIDEIDTSSQVCTVVWGKFGRLLILFFLFLLFF
jgi:hypothetical protein